MMMMDTRLGARLRNALLNVVNHRETNLAVTALFTFVALYIALAALLNRSILHPLVPVHHHHQQQQQQAPQSSSPSPSLPLPSNNNNNISSSSSSSFSSDSLPVFGSLSTFSSYFSSASFALSSTPPNSTTYRNAFAPSPNAVASFQLFALFLLWALSIGAARILGWLQLPTLLGPLLIGLLLANSVSFRTLLPPPNQQSAVLIFEFAFLFALVRAALGIDSVALRRQWALCSGLGLLCPLAECLAVLLVAHFLYAVPMPVAVLLGFAVAPSTPAVIGPTVLRLRAREIGTESGVPTAVLCSTALDNVLALTGFAVAAEIVSSHSDELSYTLTRMPTELLVGAILGMFVGVLLRSFPRTDVHWAHFQRSLALLSAASAFHFGTHAIGCSLAGPVAVLLMTGVAAMHWQVDNHRRTRMEENGFRLLWELLIGPLLFLLLGTLLDFSANFSTALLGPSLVLLLFGLLIRFSASVACAFCCFGPLNRERLFLGFSLFPKATLQAALVPGLYQFSINEHAGNGARLSLQTCLLTVLFCAPIGELMIRLLGPMLLRQKLLSTATTSIPTASGHTIVPMMAAAKGAGGVTHSDWKGRLRLELGPSDPADPATSETVAPSSNNAIIGIGPVSPARRQQHLREQPENAKL